MDEDHKSYKKIIKSSQKAADVNPETWIVGTSINSLLKAYGKAIKIS